METITMTKTKKSGKRPDYILMDKNTKAIVFGFQTRAIQRMLDFDYICRREEPSVTVIVNPTRDGMHKCFWGTKEVLIPMVKTLKEALGACALPATRNDHPSLKLRRAEDSAPHAQVHSRPQTVWARVSTRASARRAGPSSNEDVGKAVPSSAGRAE